MAALEAALNELAAQCTGENVPGEVHTLFPNWGTEYPRMSKLPSVSLRKMCSGLQAAEQQAKDEKRSADVAGYAYARGALQAAIDIHDFFGEFSGSQGGVHPPVPLGPGASGNELERLVVRLQAEAPPSVHSIFPNFCAELQSASRRAMVELRAAAARLEAAHGEVTARLFTEVGGGDSPLHREAQALAFCSRAMTALCQAKSASRVADAVAEAVSSHTQDIERDIVPPPPLPVPVAALRTPLPARPSPLRQSYTPPRAVTSTRDADLLAAALQMGAASASAHAAAMSSAANFRFRSLVNERADPFNPCCEREEQGVNGGGGFGAPIVRDRMLSPPRSVGTPPADDIELSGKLCGLPLTKMDVDDIEMEPLAPRVSPPSFTALYTAEVDLSETGGSMCDSVGGTMSDTSAWDTGGEWAY